MPRYRVFLGAPSLDELTSTEQPEAHTWTSVTCEVLPPTSNKPSQELSRLDSFGGFLPATLEAASRRISMLYENIIFRDIDSEEEFVEDEVAKVPDTTKPDMTKDITRNTQERTTWITWDPTVAETTRRETTFLRGTASFGRSRLQTQETQDTDSYARTGEYSSDASVTRFPVFHFSPHSLTPLADLEGGTRLGETHQEFSSYQGNKRKVNLLVAVFEIEGPDTIRIKRGVDAGKEVSVLKVIVGEPDGTVCRLTAWREVADRWGGNYSDSDDASLKRGDIVHLQNILVTKETSAPAAALKNHQRASTASLTASPTLHSAMTVCYRTMPEGNDPRDQKLRPDLRLGFSDAAVRQVADIVSWFQSTAGLPLN